MSNKKPHPIKNKLLHSVRNDRIWMPKKVLNKKKQQKKIGYND